MTASKNVKRIRCDFSNPDLYNPVYIPLFEDKSEFLHLFGSAGSGKSRFEAQIEIALSFDSKRRNRKTLVIRYVAATLKDSAYAELKTVIYDWGLQDNFEILKSPLGITNKITGVQFIFIGLDDVEKVKSISGVDRIWVEEATELKQRSELDQLRLRLRGFSEVKITLSYNPVDEHHWLNKEIHELLPAGHRIFKTTYKDNLKMLAKDSNYGPSIEALKDTNPNYYRVYGLGLWGKVVEGLIYSEYKIVPDFPKDYLDRDDIHVYGLDFGYSNPCALIAQHIADGTPKEKLINKEILYESGLDGVGLVRRFDELEVRKDVLMIADSARPEMIQTLVDAGYNCIACEKFAGSVLSGINRIRKYQIQIVAGSKNLVKEIQNYQKHKINGVWVEDPAPRQVDHGLDAVRYGEQLMMGPQSSGTYETGGAYAYS